MVRTTAMWVFVAPGVQNELSVHCPLLSNCAKISSGCPQAIVDHNLDPEAILGPFQAIWVF